MKRPTSRYTDPGPEWVPASALADALRVSPSAVRMLASRKLLPAGVIGRRGTANPCTFFPAELLRTLLVLRDVGLDTPTAAQVARRHSAVQTTAGVLLRPLPALPGEPRPS